MGLNLEKEIAGLGAARLSANGLCLHQSLCATLAKDRLLEDGQTMGGESMACWSGKAWHLSH